MLLKQAAQPLRKSRGTVCKGKKSDTNTHYVAGLRRLGGRFAEEAHTHKRHTHTTAVFDLRYALHRSNETAKLHSRLYACLRVCVYVFLGARACSFPVHASRDLFLGSVIILLAEIRMRFVRAPNI